MGSMLKAVSLLFVDYEVLPHIFFPCLLDVSNLAVVRIFIIGFDFSVFQARIWVTYSMSPSFLHALPFWSDYDNFPVPFSSVVAVPDKKVDNQMHSNLPQST